MSSIHQDYLNKLCQANCLIWSKVNSLQVMDGVPFTLRGTPYLVNCLNFNTPDNPDCKHSFDSIVIKKGAQSRITTSMMLYVLHSLIYQKFSKNVMYFMPTFTTVKRANSVIFSPLLNNSCIRPYVQEDNIESKKIAGHSILFIGAQPKSIGNTTEVDSANARSIPCDMILWDELDHIHDDVKEQGYERMLDSKLALEAAWGSPTIPGHGVEHRYENSTQGKWQIKCRSCGKFTCLIDNWPKCVDVKGGKWIRVCSHCNSEIFVNDGVWVDDYPGRSIVGRYISGLMTPNAKIPRAIRIWDEGTERERVHLERSFLGRGVMQSGSQLREYEVFDCCGDYFMYNHSRVETVCGVDVNDTLNVIIGLRIGEEMAKVLYAGEVRDFEQLGILCHNFNVTSMFIDAMPDMHATRRFAKESPFPVYMVRYNEFGKGFNLDVLKGECQVNRNEWCDYVHMTISQKMVTFPKVNDVIKKLARSMTKTAKIVESSNYSGVSKPRWVKLGDKQDHYFHAMLYFLLACRQAPITSGSGRVIGATTLPGRYDVDSGLSFDNNDTGGTSVPERYYKTTRLGYDNDSD